MIKETRVSDLNFELYVREPFAVEAVQITEENIEKIAALIGLGIRVKNDVKYIALDRRVVPNISRAYIGWWVTSLSDNLYGVIHQRFSPSSSWRFPKAERSLGTSTKSWRKTSRSSILRRVSKRSQNLSGARDSAPSPAG
jgi:hypothetical protein